jgi:uncharacterized membrane protein
MATESRPGADPYRAPTVEVVREQESLHGFVPGGRSLPVGVSTHWIGEAWGQFKSAPGSWIGIIIGYFIFNLILAFIPFFGSLISTVVGPILIGGIVLGCARRDQGGSIAFEDLWGAFSRYAGPLAITGLIMLGFVILSFIFFGACFAIFLGTAALGSLANLNSLLPALGGGAIALMVIVIFLWSIGFAMLYFLAPFLIVIHQMSPWAAMRMSFSGCLKNIVPLILTAIMMWLLMLASVVTLFLGLFILIPMVTSLYYVVGKDIFHDAQPG